MTILGMVSPAIDETFCRKGLGVSYGNTAGLLSMMAVLVELLARWTASFVLIPALGVFPPHSIPGNL